MKFFDLIGRPARFAEPYGPPKRATTLGHSGLVAGIRMLWCIGLPRLGHFPCLRPDARVGGVLRVAVLPAVGTFWRYLRARGLVPSQSLVRLAAALRRRVWARCAYPPAAGRVNVDTTVSPVYGDIEGARTGHDPKHRGKHGLRPVLGFLAETREALCGPPPRGETLSRAEGARQIRPFRRRPAGGRRGPACGDAECLGGESGQACAAAGRASIFGHQRCAPPFPDRGWDRPCRFVARRIRQAAAGARQWKLRDSEHSVDRVFATHRPGRPQRVIAAYDQRADAEHLLGAAQREGILAIPAQRCQAHPAFCPIVLPAYHLWRWMTLQAGHAERAKDAGQPVAEARRIRLPDPTRRIARLKMRYVAATIVSPGDRAEGRDSVHAQRAAGIIDCLASLDRRRAALRAAA